MSESAHLTQFGDWKATVTHRTCGDSVSVAAALQKRKDGDYCIVVTVIR